MRFIDIQTHSRKLVSFMLLVFAAACNPSSSQGTPDATSTLPPVDVRITSAPSPETAVQSFLDSWEAGDYPVMYTMLDTESRKGITEEEFIRRYQDASNEIALIKLDYNLNPGEKTADNAEVPFKVIMNSSVIGDITREITMKLDLEDGQWRVKWDDGLILPELAGGNYLRMDRATPPRATIYDRNGNLLAAQKEAVAIGVWPGYVDLKEDDGLISLLSLLSNYRYDTISNMISEALPGEYIPLGEVPADQDQRRLELLSTWGAAVASTYSRRLYYGSGIAPHVVGYVSAIQEEELNEYRLKGYGNDERVGRKGLEQWGETTLAGKHGGTLYVFDPAGMPIAEIGSAVSQAGQDIYTTLDREFQQQAQKAMSIYSGAIVVLEKDTGRVLAMVSTPGFDPNAFETDNYNWNSLITEIVNDPDKPQYNRATQGQYPLGSVFKLITIAAGLESGRYKSDTMFDCGYTFEELPGFTRYDWTYEHFQEDGVTKPSGMLSLPQCLIRSCNPFFWHIGLDLYRAGIPKAISDLARSYGLGSKTGIEVLDEEAGNIPDPLSEVDAINIAIGQGDVLVTPLQVARFVAALGNGGTLYRPQLIERIVPADGEDTFTFKPEAQGTLPIKTENLLLIQEAMKGVVISEIPRGTAYVAMKDLDIPVVGKTGTATSAVGDPHAWFAGYTLAEREDKPDIAVVVIAENAGEGAEIAAPIFRRIVELYFFGKPLKMYRWEAAFDVTRSPTPIITWTPTPQSGINP